MVLSSGPQFNVIVAVGTRATRRPFTYPEVQQLLELASIFQTALARSYLWSKAQRAEQLATVGLLGASVAHEIRNPLVTIKSFVHLLPQHYDDPRFRERFFRLIGEEVGRIDRLTEQLLDLAAPRHYNPVPTSLHQIINSSLELVATKADERQVVVHRDLQAAPDLVVTDANAARQVLLNLCFNGIQAQEQSSRGRWLKVATRNLGEGVELCVADHGPGIPPSARGHLFQAFHSTKSSGFGLGLAICSEILSSLNTTIAVDPYVPDEGANFRIVFPCPPLIC
jgi:signal transduction histidine kinase